MEGQKPRRRHGLAEVEPQPVEGLLDPEARVVVLEHSALLPRHQTRQSGGHGDGQQRELLQPDPPVLRRKPLSGISWQPAQGVEIQQQQDQGECDAVDLREQGGREERDGAQ